MQTTRRITRRILDLILSLLGHGGVLLLAQNVPQTLYTSSPPPPAPTVVSASAVSPAPPPAPTLVYYWVIARYPSGTSGSTPAIATNTVGSANFDGTNYVTISWTPMPGATGYDVLRSVSSVYPAPTGSCTCAVVVNTASTTVNDQSPSLAGYTQPASAASGQGAIFLDTRIDPSPSYWTTINGATYRLPPLITAGLAATDCIEYNGAGFLQSAGAACGTGSGGGFTDICAPSLAANVATVASPCTGNYGGNLITLAGDGTLSTPAGTGVVYAYLKYSDLYFGLFSATGSCNANAVCESLVSDRFPQGVVPIASWVVTAGTLGATVDRRVFNSTNGTVVNGDANIAVARTVNGDISLTCPGCGGGSTPTTRTIMETYWVMTGNNTSPIPWSNFTFTGSTQTVVSSINWYGRAGLSNMISAATDNGFNGWRAVNNGATQVSFTDMPVGGSSTWVWEFKSPSTTSFDLFLGADGAADLGSGPSDTPANGVRFRRLSGGNFFVQSCVATVCNTVDTGIALAADTNYRMTLTIPQAGNWTWQIESGNTYATSNSGTAALSYPSTNLLGIILFRNDGAVQPAFTMYYSKYYITLP